MPAAAIVLCSLPVLSAFQLPPPRVKRSFASASTSAATQRACKILALFEDDPWLKSETRSPVSGDSLDALFMHGPIVYSKRCFDSEEYNASVRKIMQRYPKISRKLAEQEVHEFLNDPNGYLAKQNDERKRTGPSEDELKPPVGVIERALVIGWVAILSFAIRIITNLSMTTPKPVMRGVEAATESLLDLPAESLNQMMP